MKSLRVLLAIVVLQLGALSILFARDVHFGQYKGPSTLFSTIWSSSLSIEVMVSQEQQEQQQEPEESALAVRDRKMEEVVAKFG